mgnify:CR=1 FL=1
MRSRRFTISSSVALILLALALLSFVTNALQSYLTLYVNIMDYGTVLMLQNSSGVLTVYEIPSSFSSVPSYYGIQKAGNPIQQVINVSLQNGEVALINEYGATGFSTQNFIYQSVSLPNIVISSGSTTIWGGAGGSSGTVTVKANEGYQVKITPWQGIQDWPVNTVETTGWKVYPYWQDGELVINSTDASTGGQYIAWRYSPVSNVINITIHITKYPESSWNPGIIIFNEQQNNNIIIDIGGFGAILWTVNGHGNSSNFGYLPEPNLNYPFTYTVILTENSAGNVTLSAEYINGTKYTVTYGTWFPWNQIYYIGIRGDINNTFYVSYFAVSPSPYGGVEAFVDSVESTAWKVLPYWQDGELVINSTDVSYAGQYVAWRYIPVSNVINITIHVASFPEQHANPGIDIFSANPPTSYDFQGGNYYWLAIQWSGAYQYSTPSSVGSVTTTSSIPNLMGKVFTETVILTENSAGNITISAIYVNGTLYSTPDINVPFPWSKIAYIGIRGDDGNIFYVSYFAVSPFQYTNVQYTINGYSLPSMPDTSQVNAIIARTTNGSYVLLGYYNGSWHEVNAPLSNPNGQITVSYGFAGPVNVTVYSSNVVSYGALFQPGNGVMLEVQNAIPPSSPNNYQPLAYVGTNGEAGGEYDYANAPFVPVTSNSLNYFEGASLAYIGWATTNFTVFSGTVGNSLGVSEPYAIVGTGYTSGGWPNTPGGYYSFSTGYINMVYILNNSVPTQYSPPDVQDLLFFFDPTYINQQGQYVNPFTNKTYQVVGSPSRFVNNINVYVFSDPNVSGVEVYVPPFTELVVRNGSTSLTFVNYDTFPYQVAKLAPGKYQFTVILMYTAYSFVLIGWQGWNVSVYLNGAPMIENDPITNQIQPFDTEGLLSAQLVADPNTKRLDIYLEPLSSGVGSYSPKEIPFPAPAPELVLPLPEATPFSLATLTEQGIATVGMVLGIFTALVRANKNLLGSAAAAGAVVAVIGVIIHLMPVVFIGAVVVILATTYRFARRQAQQ